MSKTARPLAQSSAPESPGPLALSLFLKYSLHFLIFFLAPPCLSQSTTLSLSQSPRCMGMAGCERAAERGAVAHGGREHTAAAAAWGCGEKQEQVRYRPPKKGFLSTPTNIFRSNIPQDTLAICFLLLRSPGQCITSAANVRSIAWMIHPLSWAVCFLIRPTSYSGLSIWTKCLFYNVVSYFQSHAFSFH